MDGWNFNQFFLLNDKVHRVRIADSRAPGSRSAIYGCRVCAALSRDDEVNLVAAAAGEEGVESLEYDESDVVNELTAAVSAERSPAESNTPRSRKYDYILGRTVLSAQRRLS